MARSAGEGCAGAVAAPALLSACSPGALVMPAFGSLASALKTLEALKRCAPRMTGAWDLAMAALRAFESHSGTLAPHFAHAALDKAAHARAHRMHLANHWQETAA